MGEKKPIPVRLGEELILRLDAAAKKVGNNRAGLIRFLIESWLVDFEKTGKSALPPNWEELLQQWDGRTRAAKGKPSSAASAKAGVGVLHLVKNLKKKPGAAGPNAKPGSA